MELVIGAFYAGVVQFAAAVGGAVDETLELRMRRQYVKRPRRQLGEDGLHLPADCFRLRWISGTLAVGRIANEATELRFR